MSRMKKLGKNVLAIIIGAILGLIIGLSYVLFIWIPFSGHEVGLGIIGIAPFMLVLFGLIGLVVGAVVGLVIYQIVKRYR